MIEREVVYLAGKKLRVAEDGVQWIVQRQYPQRWRNESFCRTKEALLRCVGVKPGENAVLDALPDRFGG